MYIVCLAEKAINILKGEPFMASRFIMGMGPKQVRMTVRIPTKPLKFLKADFPKSFLASHQAVAPLVASGCRGESNFFIHYLLSGLNT